MKNLEVKIEKHFISLAIIIGLIIVFIGSMSIVGVSQV